MISKRRVTDYGHAAAAAAAAEPADQQQFVAFTVGGEDYCVDIMAVREIRAWTGATSLPNSPPYVRGVINLRGAIVPVIDLRLRFGQGETAPLPASVVIIVATGDVQNGLLVDAVSDIVTVKSSDIAPVPAMEGEAANPFFRGLVTGQETLMALVDLGQLMTQRGGSRGAPAAGLEST